MSTSTKGDPLVTFKRPSNPGFSADLRKRVQAYFKDNQLKKYGNWKVYIKAAVWLTAYLLPFILMLTLDMNLWVCLGLTVLMGIAKAGIGLNIMHDAVHGTYAKKGWVNRLASKSLVLMGGSPFSWHLQHNVLHHSYTNVYEHDSDVMPGPIMRFSPSAERKWWHRFQHIYSPIFYGMMTIVWALHKDHAQVLLYHKQGLVEEHGSTIGKQMLSISAIKIFYFSYILILPLLFMDITFGQWLIGFLSMHFVAGLLLSLVFQSAHVIEDTQHPEPNENGAIEDEWLAHQLRTTANFAMNSRWFSWFAGGLNYQIEHHLFPNISHIHYKNISKIVKQCSQEYKLPYNESRTFFSAIGSHFRMLRMLGRT